ncbi:MAG: peptidoglycan editing factor PgeF [Desulfobacter sp.]|nr:MAG: peptidoglycan editing factor PgeF [Desulfobacter sp.]
MAPPDVLTFDHLSACPGLVHGVFSRAGGNSTGPFAAMNIGMGCGDRREIVAENRSRMLDRLGLDRAVFLNQVHGDEILVVKQGMDFREWVWDRETRETLRPAAADAVVTDVADLGLVIQTADCQAVVLFDPVNRVLANVHAGWRGSVANILGKCISAMSANFGCRPENVLAGISPSLGPCCAEFVNYRTEIPRPLWQYRTNRPHYFDFWAISRAQLVEMGVKPSHILAMEICTKCNANRFFSYRAQKETGRFGTVIGFKKDE